MVYYHREIAYSLNACWSTYV